VLVPGGGIVNRVLDSLAPLVRAVFPTYAYWVPRKFRVVTMRPADGRVNLQAVNKALGFPDILPVRVSPGMAGLSAILKPGAIVVVQFVDGEPTQPIITHFAAEDEQGFLPIELCIDASLMVRLGKLAIQPVARMGDAVNVGGLLPGVITTGSTKVLAE
jgi:hypothetical protein